MPVVVPIHNAVNERVWEMVLEWEKLALASSDVGGRGGGEGREGDKRESRLVSFIGRPKDLSLRARFKGFLGFVLSLILFFLPTFHSLFLSLLSLARFYALEKTTKRNLN
jgi:hypothetical protein